MPKLKQKSLTQKNRNKKQLNQIKRKNNNFRLLEKNRKKVYTNTLRSCEEFKECQKLYIQKKRKNEEFKEKEQKQQRLYKKNSKKR